MIKIPPIPECVTPNGHAGVRKNKPKGSFGFTCYHCQRCWHMVRVVQEKRFVWRISSETLLSSDQ